MTKIVPVFVAAMVLLIRVLLINTFSIAGERIFSIADERQSQYQNKPYYRPNNDSSPHTRRVVSTPCAQACTCRSFAAAL